MARDAIISCEIVNTLRRCVYTPPEKVRVDNDDPKLRATHLLQRISQNVCFQHELHMEFPTEKCICNRFRLTGCVFANTKVDKSSRLTNAT